MLRQADGKMIIAGTFTSLGSTARAYIARLNLNGTLDATFNPGTGPNASVTQMALQSDGKIVIVGYFTTVAGTARNGIARLNANGTHDTSFNPGTASDGFLSTVAVQTDGKILTGGYFHSFNGDLTRGELVRLNSNGTIDTTFVLGSGLNSSVLGVILQSDGHIIVAGDFTSVGGVSRQYLARLNANGTSDASFNAGTGLGSLDYARMAFQSSGKLVMEGYYNGATTAASRKSIFRLNTDGSLDLTFNAGAGPGSGFVLAVASDDSVVLGGGFSSVDGLARQYVARLLPNDGVDPLFNSGTALTGAVNALALQTDGKVVVAPSGMSVTPPLLDRHNHSSQAGPDLDFPDRWDRRAPHVDSSDLCGGLQGRTQCGRGLQLDVDRHDFRRAPPPPLRRRAGLGRHLLLPRSSLQPIR